MQWINLMGEGMHLDSSASDAHQGDIDGLIQERCNSIANALELRLSGTNPSTSCPIS